MSLRLHRRLILLATVSAIAAGANAAAQVRVWEDKLTLPVYEEGMPDPNPPFDQYSSSTNYPYTLRNQLTGHSADHALRAVYLENQYLKCSILPDLGGHIYTCIDKLTNQPMFYANPSIKKAGIGYRGGWAAYGLEFNFPVSHNWVTLSPVDYSYRQNADGSASVFVGNIDRVYGMQWTVEIMLRPGSTVLELKIALNNRSDVRHRFYWWSNAGVRVWEDSRIEYPMQFTASHGFMDIDTWPVDSSGMDLTQWKNQVKGPVSRFVYGSREPFMGIWHPHTNTGVVHYAEYQELPGKKIWSWGSDPDGYDWRKTLSDDDSAYMEVQGGLFRNQETYGFLQPGQTIRFREYWMPVRELGGITRANLDGVAYLSRDHGTLKVAFNANHSIPRATIRILQGSTVLHADKVDLAPEHTWMQTIASIDSTKPCTLEVADSTGMVLLQQTEGIYDWTPKAEVHTGLQKHYAMPAPSARTEDDWVQLGKDEELNGARLSALCDYQQALEKFPSSLQFAKAIGRLSADLLHYEEAARYLGQVESRETWNPETAYYLGIAYEGLGRDRDARLAFEAAARMPEWHAAASMRMGELKARDGQLAAAADDLAEALRSAPDDVRSVEELLAVDDALGRTDAARALIERWHSVYPISNFLGEEISTQAGNSQSRAEQAHMGADASRILATAAEYMRLGLYEKALRVLSHDYPPVPSDEREPGEPAPGSHPLVAYYRGYCEQNLGRPSATDYAVAAHLSTQYVFPSGAMTEKVLQAALKANPQDANAAYLLGTLHFSVGKTDTALQLWQHAGSIDPHIPALDASMGRALLHLNKDAEDARTTFQRGALIDDPKNVSNYWGLDQSLSLLHRPATERVVALRSYPNLASMPTDLLYELALNLSETGDYASAETLFHHRFFQRAEGGTNVRQVWIEVRLQQALAWRKQGQCTKALAVIDTLDAPVAELEFTHDGMQAVLETARYQYLIGETDAACTERDAARAHFQKAAMQTTGGQAAWAVMAARKLDGYDDAHWHTLLSAALEAVINSGSGSYTAGMLQRQLGDEAAAKAAFHDAFLTADSQMSYHLTRLALAEPAP